MVLRIVEPSELSGCSRSGTFAFVPAGLFGADNKTRRDHEEITRAVHGSRDPLVIRKELREGRLTGQDPCRVGSYTRE